MVVNERGEVQQAVDALADVTAEVRLLVCALGSNVLQGFIISNKPAAVGAAKVQVWIGNGQPDSQPFGTYFRGSLCDTSEYS